VSQGELYKEICDEWSSWAGDFIERGSIQAFLKEVLDEARNDIPNYDEFLKLHGWETPSEYSIAVDKWFKKWFGDNKK